jgi:aerobic carbon-monoxide dehydrogenase medium subunit
MFIKRMPKFAYHAPTSLSEAIALMEEYGPKKASLYAGGTDLFVAMKKRGYTPDALINLKSIEGLTGIDFDAQKGITIGGLATLGDIARSEIVKQHLPPLWDAVQVMASVQIRNLATIGGNLCSAWPSADTAPPLIALGASVKLHGAKGERTVLVENYFARAGKSVIEPDEILTQVTIPVPQLNSTGTYLKLMRRNAMDLSMVGVATLLVLDSDNTVCKDALIVLGAVAPTPVRALEAEKIIVNKAIDLDVAAQAGQIASDNVNPRTSIRASGEYRKEMVAVQVKRALLTSYARLQKS